MLEVKDIKEVFSSLKNRDENPRGEFDKQGRFYAEFSELMSVRSPSKSYPYSQMTSARTLKFVKALAEKFDCKNKSDLETYAFA